MKELEDSLEALAILKDYTSPWPLDSDGMPIVDGGGVESATAVRSSDGDVSDAVSRADLSMVVYGSLLLRTY